MKKEINKFLYFYRFLATGFDYAISYIGCGDYYLIYTYCKV